MSAWGRGEVDLTIAYFGGLGVCQDSALVGGLLLAVVNSSCYLKWDFGELEEPIIRD